MESASIMERAKSNGIKIVEGDITKVIADAIVNPSNRDLILGAGVSGAISAAGGPEIAEEMRALAPIDVGAAVETGAGELPHKYVIHAVGPQMGEGDEDEKLKMATLAALKVADRLGLNSIVFPAISTGIYRFPAERCAEIMISAVLSYRQERADTGLREIIFALFGSPMYRIFSDELRRQQG